jgi:hypothetical protein
VVEHAKERTILRALDPVKEQLNITPYLAENH